MPRLIRPPISVEVKCRVALRQLGEMWPSAVIDCVRADHTPGGLGGLLARLLERLAALLGCEVKDLRCDHDPALGARVKVFRKGKHVDYKPAGSDPEYLAYRPHGPQFARSHLIKTYVRGDHGQHPDRVLIKKQRRREQGPKPKRKWGRPHLARTKPKPRWGSRPLKNASRWPAKGTQKFRRKR